MYVCLLCTWTYWLCVYYLHEHIRYVCTIIINIFVMFVQCTMYWTYLLCLFYVHELFVMIVLCSSTYSLCLYYVHCTRTYLFSSSLSWPEDTCVIIWCTMYIFRIWEIIEEGKMKSITDGVRIGTSMYGAVHFTVQYTLLCSTLYNAVHLLYKAVHFTVQYTLQCSTLYSAEHFLVQYTLQCITF